MIDLLRQRRSIRNYLDKPIEAEKIQCLQEAMLRSPSSKNRNPWEFIFIDDKELIGRLKECKPHGSAPLASAPLAIVICADSSLSDVWVEDCSIAAILLQLTASSLGLGSCWIQVRNRNFSEEVSSETYIRELLGIPEKYRVLNIVSVGYPATHRSGQPSDELQYDKIRKNRFQ